MDSLNVLIVDDEHLARQKILRFLKEAKQKVNMDEATNGLEALHKIPMFNPDIVFLDVQMPGLTGFEVLQHLQDRKFKVIFQTAYDEYAIQAFEENACDYLLKPFTQERFNKALGRALLSLKQRDNFEGLEKNLINHKIYLKKIAVKQGSKLKLIDVDEIFCIVSKDHYTCVYTSNGEFICDPSLSHLTKRLPPDGFWRLHRNNIVKVSAIKAIGGGDNMSVELANGFKLPVSRNNRKKIKEFLE